MNLAQLAYACHIYEVAATFGTDYDSSYAQFLASTGGVADLSLPTHCRTLLVWLNKWGCRQFRPSQYEETALRLEQWYAQCEQLLPPRDRLLLELSRQELEALGEAYGKLKQTIASHKRREGMSLEVTVGPTGAAKVLFALRPHAAIPWDIPMRHALHHSGSPKSYVRYLEYVRTNLEGLGRECKCRGFALTDLPARTGQPGSTLTKLIDEYHWVTITHAYPMPEEHKLLAWTESLVG